MSLQLRVGQGYDIHKLVANRPLIIGGVQIEHSHGLLGHSDADVLLHALTDALLGAAGMGDIGQLFPDTDAQYHNADSRVLLRQAFAKVQAVGWQVVNIDATILAQAPKMAPHTPQMRAHIAADLGLELDQINLKATTNEGLGPIGRQEGIAAQAVVLLQR